MDPRLRYLTHEYRSRFILQEVANARICHRTSTTGAAAAATWATDSPPMTTTTTTVAEMAATATGPSPPRKTSLPCRWRYSDRLKSGMRRLLHRCCPHLSRGQPGYGNSITYHFPHFDSNRSPHEVTVELLNSRYFRIPLRSWLKKNWPYRVPRLLLYPLSAAVYMLLRIDEVNSTN